MRKTFFLFAMFVNVAASAQVTHVEPVGANYTNKTVTFRVWWNAGSRDATHLSKVWVWVDYIKINSNNTTSGNMWTRADVSAASPTASISYDGSNRQGFWLQGNTSTNYSATLTVQLNITETKFNWCAYASDYPPNVTLDKGTYTFKGTPPFTLIAANGTTTQTVTGKTLLTSVLTITPTTIRDRTECPGVFCPYAGSDLYIDATHLCQQRTSGAMNWEAYIKDSRDNQIYRITQFLDNNWWFADNLAIAEKSVATCNGMRQYQGSNPPNCPTGWRIPTYSEYRNRWVNMVQYLNDNYGGSSYGDTYYLAHNCWQGATLKICTTPAERKSVPFRTLVTSSQVATVAALEGGWGCHCNDCTHENGTMGQIRCIRQ
jgi:hypothetical protein